MWSSFSFRFLPFTSHNLEINEHTVIDESPLVLVPESSLYLFSVDILSQKTVFALFGIKQQTETVKVLLITLTTCLSPHLALCVTVIVVTAIREVLALRYYLQTLIP